MCNKAVGACVFFLSLVMKMFFFCFRVKALCLRNLRDFMKVKVIKANSVDNFIFHKMFVKLKTQSSLLLQDSTNPIIQALNPNLQ